MKNSQMKRPKRNIVQIIRNHYHGLGKAYKKVADFILNNLESATFVSLGEISSQIGVSDATIIRFAKELGYSGYQGLREDLVNYIRKVLYPVQKLTMSIAQKNIPTLEIVKQTDINFIHQTIDNIQRDWFENIIKLILSANRIFCMGWGLSSFLAEFLTFQLRRLSLDACSITRDRRPMLEQVLFLRKGDLLIVFDLLLYCQEVLEAVEYLHDHNKGIKIITITNDSLAHIVQYADVSLFCSTLGPKKSTLISLTSPLCLINCIIEELIVKNPKRAKRAIMKFEQEVLSNPNYYYQIEFNKFK